MRGDDVAQQLPAARAGDSDAFGRLVEPFRDELQAHCYRMLGSLHEAEDATQEALARAWRGLKGYDDHGSFRSGQRAATIPVSARNGAPGSGTR